MAKPMEIETLTHILAQHALWAENPKTGCRANLEGVNLSYANLKRVNLERANLKGANLFGANLEDSILYSADLRLVNLQGVSLCRR